MIAASSAHTSESNTTITITLLSGATNSNTHTPRATNTQSRNAVQQNGTAVSTTARADENKEQQQQQQTNINIVLKKQPQQSSASSSCSDGLICRGFVHTFALSSDYNAICCVRCDGGRAYTCTCTNIWIVSVMSLRVNRLPLTCYPRSDVLLYITDCNVGRGSGQGRKGRDAKKRAL
jgi:hypothetical protein